MKVNLFVAMAASGLLLAGTASAQEKKIKRSDLPPAVEKTVAAESTGATIKGFSTEKEKGETLRSGNDGQWPQQGCSDRR